MLFGASAHEGRLRPARLLGETLLAAGLFIAWGLLLAPPYRRDPVPSYLPTP